MNSEEIRGELKGELKGKLLAMDTEDLITAMVEGLRKRHTEIDMDTFGRIRDNVCFGCAATNAFLELLGVQAKEYLLVRQTLKISDLTIIISLESFFDALRRGEFLFLRAGGFLASINKALGKEGHFKPIKLPEGLHLPKLTNDYTEEDLQAYEKLADFQ